MFRCQVCQAIVPAGTRSHRIVVKTRAKTYEARGHRPGFDRNFRGRGRTLTTKRGVYDRGGSGHEIVRELLVCPACAERVAPAEPTAAE